jgi:CheY-like chemotaxis protein
VPRSVLIVDDSESFLNAARVLLERDGMRVVAVASTGPEALALAHRLVPDIVLLDINLGGESGFGVAEDLAGHYGGRPAPVILTSTHAESDFAELIAESPAIGFLPKSELSAASIEQVLDDSRAR